MQDEREDKKMRQLLSVQVNGTFKFYFCPECPNFKSRALERYNMHIIRVHQKGVMSCGLPDCEFVAKNMKRLKNHYQIHAEVSRQFKCGTCSLAFFTKQEAFDHQSEVHKWTNTLKCNFPYCFFKSQKKKTMYWHEKKCHDENFQIKKK